MARFGFLVSLVSALVAVTAVQAVPFNSTLGERADGLSPVARDILLSARAVPTSPRWVAYFDKFVSSSSLPAVSTLQGFNVFALAFVYSASAQDNAATWQQLDAATRASIKSQVKNNNNSLDAQSIISCPVRSRRYQSDCLRIWLGSVPTSAGDDPTASANFIANYVKTYGLDGVDVDYEDFSAVETSGTAVAWLTTFTKALRAQLPAGQYILTHAPVAPWFTPNRWPGNGYLGVHAAVGDLIDWYNIQFYNQGVTEYVDCAGLLTQSSSAWPQSSVFEIAANGVDLNKLVIGKPATTADANNGYMDPATLSGCLAQAKAKGWSAGAMTLAIPQCRIRLDHPAGAWDKTSTCATTLVPATAAGPPAYQGCRDAGLSPMVTT
ncbi:glycoside hydrolase family 18 protein, partial [Mycena vitilis]